MYMCTSSRCLHAVDNDEFVFCFYWVSVFKEGSRNIFLLLKDTRHTKTVLFTACRNRVD